MGATMGNEETGCGHPDCLSPGLVLAPFRALRLNPSQVDLAAATSPPYDVVDEHDVIDLERREAHNVVRLTRPHGVGDPYRRAARTLGRWRADGVLVREATDALYLVEQAADGVVYRALAGAVALRHPEDGVVLPHEQVMPGPVADRLALLRATATHLEPILLTTDAGQGVVRIAAGACSSRPPLVDFVVGATRHRVWRVDDQESLGVLADRLARVRALIADGHHRFTAALALRDQMHAAGHGHGPWDYALAHLVDTSTESLRLDGIHRALSGVPLDRLVAALRQVPGLALREADRAEVEATLELGRAGHPKGGQAGDGAPHARRSDAGQVFGLTDGKRWLTARDERHTLEGMLPAGTPPGWRRLGTALLHEVVLGRLLPVEEAAISYHHDLTSALRAVTAGPGAPPGCAVLLGAPALSDVIGLAAAGVRVPRKTTSFGPKPRTGLLMLPLDGLPPDAAHRPATR